MTDLTSSNPDAPQRWRALRQLEAWLDAPMMVLGLAWLALVIAELVWGTSRLFETFGTAIWIVFLVEFAIRFFLAPEKRAFLARNWLTVLALLAPALRLVKGLRFLRFARASRSLSLVKIIGTANRAMNTLRRRLRRRGLGYVVAFTLTVCVLGAAGMYAFESAADVSGGFKSYGEALWWTAMLLTTMGSEFWPRTIEGRVLCFLLSVYAFMIFGYITAILATYFLGADGSSKEHAQLQALSALREEIARLRNDVTGRTQDS
jgi:voltage-gated potassium channel